MPLIWSHCHPARQLAEVEKREALHLPSWRQAFQSPTHISCSSCSITWKPLWKKHILYSIVWNLNLKGVAIVSPTSFNWNFKHPSSYVRFWGPTHGPFLCTWLVGPSRDVGNLELGKTTGQLESQKNCWNRKMAGKWSTKAENSLRHGLVKYHGQGQRFVQVPSIFNSWERNSNIWHKDAQGHGLWPSPRSLLNDFRMAMDELLASPEQVHGRCFFFRVFPILLEV